MIIAVVKTWFVNNGRNGYSEPESKHSFEEKSEKPPKKKIQGRILLKKTKGLVNARIPTVRNYEDLEVALPTGIPSAWWFCGQALHWSWCYNEPNKRAGIPLLVLFKFFHYRQFKALKHDFVHVCLNHHITIQDT